ncbi:MAG: DUF2275 domain-containing protein [Geobacteraceae bacterium]|nr:DUF2275 domain-containing protein [Geobacteraceae bacterium]
MNSHADIQRRLSAYCGGDLEPEERQLVEAHLAECPACRAGLADLQTALRLIRSTPEMDPPPWMTARIMTRIREQQAGGMGWLRRFFFPLHIKLPLEAMALLIVCVSGYYLTRTVETDLEQTRQQRLQENPAPAAAPPAAVPEQTSDKNAARKRPGEPQPEKDATRFVAPDPMHTTDHTPAAAAPMIPPARVPSAPVFSDRQEGSAESMKAAPAAELSNRAREAAPGMKQKIIRSAEQQTDSTIPASAGRTGSAPALRAVPQVVLRLNVDDPAQAAAMVNEAVLRSGGTVTEEPGPPTRHIKARIPAARLSDLLERLERAGRITARPLQPTGAQLLELTIQW